MRRRPGTRRLVVAGADRAPLHGTPFVVSRRLSQGLLVLVGNKRHPYITGTNVTDQQGDTLAGLTRTPAWTIHGDQAGQGGTALVRFLTQGDVLLVDDGLI